MPVIFIDLAAVCAVLLFIDGQFLLEEIRCPANGATMTREYVEQRDGGFWITGTRVSLDSIVYAFLRGAPREGIAQSFPGLTLEEVDGAINYYRDHQADVDSYLRQGDREFESLRTQARQANPDLYKKLEDARKIEKACQRLDR